MNYGGHEKLRAEVAALANSMCDVRTTLNRLEAITRYDADSLAERLIKQTLRRINALYLEAYKEVIELDENFQD
ncbi:hypothetical protein LSB85_004484 [Salmonella enterica]|uniref:hypothetical protein n=1 Tax=Salmonella enterica TaxID=28901 RepID=UPI000FBE86BF|nr:hypothetical protein [Salmonella enterica]EBZ0493691.1 hypothetical protein [Salmonella enterica subsp. enterica serovar Infantis]ECL7345111.1 hypothetical protein [Salmonella enterica subsp. enterica serovar Menston]EGI5923457.1 hypothetical protein [Salmonella enterica subsp. enterica serovar Colindale]MIX29389.1 hypothetical protein [Salmonella enterica subsp. enterica serovar Livingstone]EIP3952587.1 hypothetical protein [Salmonella enterica]